MIEKAWILMSAQKEVRSVHRDMNVKGVSCEDSEGNEEHFILK